MPTVDQLYDEAIDLQQAGNLGEAVGKLEGLIADHADYALGHAALSVFYGKLDRQDEAVKHAERGPKNGHAEAVYRTTRGIMPVDSRPRSRGFGNPTGLPRGASLS